MTAHRDELERRRVAAAGGGSDAWAPDGSASAARPGDRIVLDDGGKRR